MPDLTSIPLNELTRQHFEPAIGTSFEIPFDDGSVHQLELNDTRDVFAGGGPNEQQRKPFALSFLGAKDKYVKQGIYPLRHSEFGTLSLFIVPLGPDRASGRIQYEAIFT